MSKATMLVPLLMTACGSSNKPKTWSVPPTPRAERTIDAWTDADEALYISRTCTNIVGADGALRCDSLTRAGLSATDCTGSMNKLRSSTSGDSQRQAFRLVVAGLSMAESCEEVDATFRAASASLWLAKQSPRLPAIPGCNRTEMFGPFQLTNDEMRRRHGQGARSFSETASSLSQPIAVCGVRGSLAWLTTMTCADGSRPWGNDLGKAHAARKGSNISDQPCGPVVVSVPVDIYEVPCPEKRYEVYVDMYECGPGEQFE